MSWFDRFRRRKPARRTTFKDRGRNPFGGIHRAGRPSVQIGVGTETRPLILPPPGKPYPGVERSWAELSKCFKPLDLNGENQGEGIDDRVD